jgi:hypothetical protein
MNNKKIEKVFSGDNGVYNYVMASVDYEIPYSWQEDKPKGYFLSISFFKSTITKFNGISILEYEYIPSGEDNLWVLLEKAGRFNRKKLEKLASDILNQDKLNEYLEKYNKKTKVVAK